MLGGGRMQLVGAQQGAVAVALKDRLGGFLDYLRDKIQVGNHVEGPAQVQVEVEIVDEVRFGADPAFFGPDPAGVAPEVLEHADPVDGLALKDVADAFTSGHGLHRKASSRYILIVLP